MVASCPSSNIHRWPDLSQHFHTIPTTVWLPRVVPRLRSHLCLFVWHSWQLESDKIRGVTLQLNWLPCWKSALFSFLKVPHHSSSYFRPPKKNNFGFAGLFSSSPRNSQKNILCICLSHIKQCLGNILLLGTRLPVLVNFLLFTILHCTLQPSHAQKGTMWFPVFMLLPTCSLCLEIQPLGLITRPRSILLIMFQILSVYWVH